MADRLADILRSGGWPKANRPLIIREALARLEEDIAGKSPEQVFRYFVDRQARRAQAKPQSEPLASHPGRETPDQSEDK